MQLDTARNSTPPWGTEPELDLVVEAFEELQKDASERRLWTANILAELDLPS